MQNYISKLLLGFLLLHVACIGHATGFSGSSAQVAASFPAEQIMDLQKKWSAH